jgi:hypothetical protein
MTAAGATDMFCARSEWSSAGGENDSSIARELARQTDSESYFRVWELHHKHELLQLGREKLRQKQVHVVCVCVCVCVCGRCVCAMKV